MERSKKKICPKYLVVHSFGYGYRPFAALKDAKEYFKECGGARGNNSTFLVKVRQAK